MLLLIPPFQLKFYPLFLFFLLHFFSFIMDNCSYGSLLIQCLKTNIFSPFAIVFYFLQICFYNIFASAIICQCTIKKIQISFGKSLSNCRAPCQILKAAKWFFLTVVHSMKCWTATTRHGITRKSSKTLKHTGDHFRKNLQLIGLC